jgi:hypothetical protein
MCGLAAMTLLAAGCAPRAAGSAPPDAPAVDAGLPRSALVEPVDPDHPRTGPAVVEIGRTYPFDLFTHCGIAYAPFGGQTWKAVEPRPEPPAVAGPDGITVYSGYTAGTMTLVDAETARFVVDVRYAAAADPVVDFRRSDERMPICK